MTDYLVLVKAHVSEFAPDTSIPNAVLPEDWTSTGSMLNWDAFFNHAMALPIPDGPQIEAQPIDLETWTSGFFEDPILDWIGLDGQNPQTFV